MRDGSGRRGTDSQGLDVTKANATHHGFAGGVARKP
jgi:hypothetical protein